MPTRLLLEGADLAELMVHVRAEFGPTARIVRAERVRSGGVAGFFARQRYELTIEVPDAPAAPAVPSLRARRAAVAGAGGLESLLAAADAADAAEGDALVPAPGSGVTAPAPGEVRVSTGEEAFASVLERMRALAGLPEDHQLEVPPPAGAGGAAGAGAAGAAAGAVAGTLAADRVFEPLAPAALPAAGGPVVPAPAAPPAVESRPAPAAVPTGAGVPRAALEELGVPADLLAACGDGPVELSRLLAAVPPAPVAPREPGTVVVVVGPPEDAVRTADLLALRLGAAGGSVVHAGDVEAVPGHGRRLTTPAAAERWRARAAESAEPTVVALGVRPGRAREQAAAELLAALAPDQAWAVVDARSKRRDCLRWLAEVGARRAVDALAVGGLFETSEPGTVLGLGVPVAWVDGVPASRVAWAAALGEHLPEGTAWG